MLFQMQSNKDGKFQKMQKRPNKFLKDLIDLCWIQLSNTCKIKEFNLWEELESQPNQIDSYLSFLFLIINSCKKVNEINH